MSMCPRCPWYTRVSCIAGTLGWCLYIGCPAWLHIIVYSLTGIHGVLCVYMVTVLGAPISLIMCMYENSLINRVSQRTACSPKIRPEQK